MAASRVLLVANQTATAEPLLAAVRARAARGAATFHLVVPATPAGLLHRLIDPEVAGVEAAQRQLDAALPLLSAAAGQTVDGHVGDADPLAAVHDAVHLHGFDEIILSTLPSRLSRWTKLDLESKVRASLGLPMVVVTGDVEAESAAPAPPTSVA